MVEKLDNTYFLKLINGLKYDEKNDLYLFGDKTYRYKGKALLFESRKRYAHYFINVNDTSDIVSVTAGNDIPLYDGFNQVDVDRTLREKCHSRYAYEKYTLPRIREQQKRNAEVRQAWKEELQKQKEAEAEERKKQREAKLQPRKCAFCGKEFKPTQEPHRFCCAECRIKYFSREQGKKVVESHKVTLNCKVCGKEFTGTPRQRYCSEECREKYEKAMDKAKKKALRELQKANKK